MVNPPLDIVEEFQIADYGYEGTQKKAQSQGADAECQESVGSRAGGGDQKLPEMYLEGGLYIYTRAAMPTPNPNPYSGPLWGPLYPRLFSAFGPLCAAFGSR